MAKPNYYDNVRTDVINLLPKKSYKRILEIGGGTFSSLLKLKQIYGSECWGVDIHDTKASGLKFINGNIESEDVNKEIPINYFDLVMSNDVIEHLVDTKEVLKILNRSMIVGGILAVSVPNVRQIRFGYNILFRGTFPRNPSGMFDQTHLRWFCKRDIVNMISEAGFEIVDSVNVGRLVPRLISRSIIAQFLGLQTIVIAKKI